MNTELDYLERIANALERIAILMEEKNDITRFGKKKHKLLPEREEGNNHQNAWVLEPYNVCITTLPAQYLTTIYHYHDKDGLYEPALNRGPNTKIFYTEDEAIKYCKINLGCEYQIVDIPPSQTVVIGDDYE